MDFIDEVKLLSTRAENIMSQLKTEEATKQSLILPFIQLLGYNVFEPHEVIPEFVADVGTKKGEKVDYAIVVNGKPAILVEAKSVDDKLTAHDAQLFRYFTSTEAKFAILTNGITYKFFSDLQQPNKMDDTPFLEFDLLDLKETLVQEIKKFHKENFNIDEVFSAASNLKYTTQIKTIMDAQLKDPNDDFVRFWLTKEVYSGKVTQNVLEKFKPLVKKALNQYISDLIGERLKSAIQTTMDTDKEVAVSTNTSSVEDTPIEENNAPQKPKIITTSEELEGFYLVKTLLREFIDDPTRIVYKDTASYFAVLIDGNVRKWICRFAFNKNKSMSIQQEDKTEKWFSIDSLDDIYKYKDELAAILNKLIE